MPLAPNESRVIEHTCALLAVDSIGGTPGELRIQHEAAAAAGDEGWQVYTWSIDVADLASRDDFPGMEVDRESALGVLARMPGSGGGRTLLIDAHTDVVPPGDLGAWSHDPFTAVRSQIAGRASIVGRGACDMKAGLAAAWEAMRMVREAGIELRGDVVLAPVSGEEDGGVGTYALIEKMRSLGIRPDGCIIPEPTNLDVVPANGGALTFRLRVPGAAIHASRRTEGVSAIEKFIPIMQAMTELERTRNVHVDPLMQRWPVAYPLAIGTVQAGDWASTVPDLLVAEGRLGVALDESVEDARAALENAVADACNQDEWLHAHPATVEWWGGQFAAGSTDSDAQIASMVRTAHARVTGREPETYGAPYGSDLRLLTGLADIPTVQYGPGDTSQAHAPDEYVAIEDVLTCASVLAEVIVDFCG